MTDKSIWRLRRVLGEIEDLYKTTKQDTCNHFVDANNTIEMSENEDEEITEKENDKTREDKQ